MRRHAECSSAPIAPQVTVLRRLQSRAKRRERGFAWRTSCAVRPQLARFGRRNPVSTTATRASSIDIADQTVVRTGGAPRLARIWSAIASAQLRTAADSILFRKLPLIMACLMLSVCLRASGTPQARQCARARTSSAAPGALSRWFTTAFATKLAIRQLACTMLEAATSRRPQRALRQPLHVPLGGQTPAERA